MIAVIIQARMRSTRLPGKVFKSISGRPMLWHVLMRVRQAESLDTIVIATSDEVADNPIADFCAQEGVSCFRGNESDVLDRFYQAARWIGADVIVRISADCPMIDPVVLDAVVTAYRKNRCDYACNAIHRTYPDGLDTEVFSFEVLEKAWKEASLKSEREHVTPYIWKNEALFNLHHVMQEHDLSALRWTVDEPEDLTFVRRIYEHLYVPNAVFHMEDILRLLGTHPELSTLNDGFTTNEGYQRSLENDGEK